MRSNNKILKKIKRAIFKYKRLFYKEEEYVNKVDNSKETVVIFSHTDYLNSLGGTEKYILEHVEELRKNDFDIIQIFPLNRNEKFLAYKENQKYGINHNNEFKGSFSVSEILSVLKNYDIKYSYIHHLLFWQLEDFKELITYIFEEKASVRFFAHDFFACCSSIHMIYQKDGKRTPCLLKEDCSKCAYGEDIDKWQVFFKDLFKKVEYIIVPSDYVKNMLAAIFSDIVDKVVVWGHLKLELINKTKLRTDEVPKYRIAYLGYRSPNKGWETWEKVYSDEDVLRVNDLYHIGSAENYSNNVKTIEYSAIKNGRMEPVRILGENNIDIVVLWSIVPESYSYTMYEAIAAGIPIITNYKSGNICEKILSNSDLGVVLESDEELIEFLTDKRKIEGLISKEREMYELRYNTLPV